MGVVQQGVRECVCVYFWGNPFVHQKNKLNIKPPLIHWG